MHWHKMNMLIYSIPPLPHSKKKREKEAQTLCFLILFELLCLWYSWWLVQVLLLMRNLTVNLSNPDFEPIVSIFYFLKLFYCCCCCDNNIVVHISVILIVRMHLLSLMKLTFLKPHLPSKCSLSAEFGVFDILINCSKMSSISILRCLPTLLVLAHWRILYVIIKQKLQSLCNDRW